VDFITYWCLGVPPIHPEDELRLALVALERHLPERLDTFEREQRRGLMYIHPAVQVGLTLHHCESLTGFATVLARVRIGQDSALSELEFAAALVHIGLHPSLEPQLGSKKLDTRFEYDGRSFYCEVIAPERSDAMEDASEQMSALAKRLVQENPDSDIEVLLSPDFDFAKSDELAARICATEISLKKQNVPEAGSFIKFGPLSAPIVSPRLISTAIGPVLGTASMVNNGGKITNAVVRLPASDWRAERLLTAELHHFARDQHNLLAMDVSQVPGGMKDWAPLLQKRFQPTRNRRIGAVILYEQGGLVGLKMQVWQRWRVLRNPHAYMPIPQPLLDSIATLDHGEIPLQ
jgi:hypothetical protein